MKVSPSTWNLGSLMMERPYKLVVILTWHGGMTSSTKQGKRGDCYYMYVASSRSTYDQK